MAQIDPFTYNPSYDQGPGDLSNAGSAPPLHQGGPPVRATYTPSPDTGPPLTAPYPVQFDPQTGQPMVKAIPPPATDPTQDAVDRSFAQQASGVGFNECVRHLCPPDFNGMLCTFRNSLVPSKFRQACPQQTNCLCWSDLIAYGGLFLVTLLGAALIVGSRR